MPRLSILTAEEINAFDKPPLFTALQRQKYFHLTDSLRALFDELRSSTNQVGAILHWGYFRATGRFFNAIDFRKTDIKYVIQLLDLSHEASEF